MEDGLWRCHLILHALNSVRVAFSHQAVVSWWSDTKGVVGQWTTGRVIRVCTNL